MKSYIENFKKYRFLLWELVKKGVKLKYRRSYLGILWTLLEPLMTMIVLSVVFGTLFGNKDPHFPVYILCGRLMYSFFSSATNGAMKAIRTNAGMIKKVYVPKYIYPLSSVLFNYIIFAISLIVLVVVSIVLKVYPTIYLAQAIIPLILLLITAFGVGMILSTMAVFFRDLEYLWSVGLMIIMYASAIFYKPEKLLKSGFGWILKCNPLYLLIHNFRQAVFGMPMNMKFLAASIVFAIVSVIVGLIFFYKKQDEFILHVGMKFNLSQEKVDDLKDYVIKLLKHQISYNEFWALKDINFTLNKGDRLGILGLNGAGKSTLLKVIAGVLKATEGTVTAKGKIAPLLELGAGFDQQYTGRENIYLYGAVLGFSKKFLDEKLDEIIEFSELGKFIDVPVKNYSSGMKSRLGFSVATLVEPDILILDEVLSVGDAKFRKKSEAKIMSMFDKGVTVLFVSHSLDQVKRLCNKAILLEKGKIISHGSIEEVSKVYEEKTK